MFLKHHVTVPVALGFPRVRGDVPSGVALVGGGDLFSPRARGCSADRRHDSCCAPVFPACAGMFLFLHHGRSRRRSFPRVRGDVPQPAPTLERVKVFSPRARGCSYFLSRGRALDGVFPAYAGMFLLPESGQGA